MKPKYPRLLPSILIVAGSISALLNSSSALAATWIWDGPKDSSGDFNWNTGTNWNPDTVPNNDAATILSVSDTDGFDITTNVSGISFGRLNVAVTNTFSTFRTSNTNTITLQNSTSAFIIDTTGSNASSGWNPRGLIASTGTQGLQKLGNGILTFRFNSVVQTYQGLVDIQAGGVELQRNESLGNLANDVKIGNAYLAHSGNNDTYANLVLTSGRTIELTNANSRIVTDGVTNGTTLRNLEIQGQITGTGSLNKEGGNTLTLSGAGNNFLNTEVRRGTLTIASGSSLGTGTIAVLRDTLNLNNTAQTATGLTLGNATAAGLSQTLNLASGHTLSLTGNITYNANNNGISTIAGPGRLAASGAGRVIDVGNGTLATDLTISAVLTGTQNFEKRGLGTLLMSGGTTAFTGGLVHGFGTTNYTTNTFTIGGFGMNGQSANTSPVVNVSTGFNVNMSQYSDVIIGDQTGTGTSTLNIDSGGNMLITGAGSNQRPFAVANGSGSSDATGVVNLSGGKLTIAANQVDVGIGGNKLRTVRTSNGTVNINSGSTFEVLGASSTSNSIYLGTTRLESGGAAANAGTTQTGTVNINSGGTFETSRTITRGAESGNTTVGNLNLDGGTLRAGTADNSAWVSGLTQFALGSAGGTINTNGRTMGIGMAISGAGELTKSGAGTLVLDSANTYLGGTAVTNGTLLINNTVGSGTGSGAVSVSGGVLGGTGTISGAIGIGASGTLSPTAQASGGKLTVGAATFAAGSIFDWDLTTADKTDPGAATSNFGNYGQLAATSASGSSVFNVTLLGGGTGTDSYADAFWNTNKTWTNVFDATGLTDLTSLFSSFSGDGLVTSGSGSSIIGTAGGEGHFSFSSTSLNWTAVPEPTTALAGLLLGAGLLRRRRQ